MASNQKSKPNIYGIAEWYGNLYAGLSDAKRRHFLSEKTPDFECRFLEDVPALAPQSKFGPRLKCNKLGGVCSLRNFVGKAGTATDFGPITATCPNRFLENREIFDSIRNDILQCESLVVAKEIPFLHGAKLNPFGENRAQGNRGKKDVGRIDLVCVDRSTIGSNYLNWCAVEMQAVYFSGSGMASDYGAIEEYSGSGVPMPGGKRRPDFRSSGPKRLMPQLQTKVPTLRRWGKKMVVVVDRPFVESLGTFRERRDPSNADIVWLVVNYKGDNDQKFARLFVDDLIYTTLEDSVECLTAGEPTKLSEFEAKLLLKVEQQRAVFD